MQDLQLKKQINRAFFLLITALLFSAGFTSGCSGPAKAPATAPSGQAQKQAIVSAPTKTTAEKVQETVTVYEYKPGGRRDPFAPIIQRENKKAKAGDRPPLERHNLTEYKLSGIIWGGFGYNAMLEGPDGKGYFVRVGTILGPNRGIIKKITQNLLIVEEQYKNYAGETERKETVIELRKKQEAMQ